VLAALARVAPGEVLSYGDLAAEAGFPGAARAVGAVLSALRNEPLPWWRVVYSDGRLAPGHEADQARRLATEGVSLRAGRVVLAGGQVSGQVKGQVSAPEPLGSQ
jgi:methylated-DNA-protein-cysteine methyltransferase-like protein